MSLICDGRGAHRWLIPSEPGANPDPTWRDWRCLNCDARKPDPAPQSSRWASEQRGRVGKPGKVSDLRAAAELAQELAP